MKRPRRKVERRKFYSLVMGLRSIEPVVLFRGIDYVSYPALLSLFTCIVPRPYILPSVLLNTLPIQAINQCSS
jgi:hypothetical protein